MRFKSWFLQEGGASTPIYHGGLMDFPASYTNVNLPVRSKYVTKGSIKELPIGEPDKLFGFHEPEDKIRSREREAGYIDKKRKKVPLTRIPPDTIY